MTEPSSAKQQIADADLQQHRLELENNGLTILPSALTGITMEQVDRCVDVLLQQFTTRTGCPISLQEGPLGGLTWPQSDGPPLTLADPGGPDPTQVILQQLLQMDRCFRDLAVNPVVVALIDEMIGPYFGDMRARRLSSVNSFMKWQGEFGYGESMGFHVDQGGNPLPWGRPSLTANATWCLTDYSLENGALAFVPGSHKRLCLPTQPEASRQAVPVECPRGSVIIFHGATWHGAFPKITPGMRINVVNYYRHTQLVPQEHMRLTMLDQPWEDCDDPALMRELIGFDDQFPYLEQALPLPTLTD